MWFFLFPFVLIPVKKIDFLIEIFLLVMVALRFDYENAFECV